MGHASLEWKYDFGTGPVTEGYSQVLPTTVYQPDTGYGFADCSRVASRDRQEPDSLRRDFCIPLDAAFIADIPNGDYTVTVTMGDYRTSSCTTLYVHPRRYVLEDLRLGSGQFYTGSFSVRVTDNQLRLGFGGITPRINALEIRQARELTTVYLAGDSTVTNQSEESYPYAGWGQWLPYYFTQNVIVDNHAMSGRSSRSFISEGRLDAIAARIRPGDFLFIQFGHNDEKPDAKRATVPGTTYKEHLQRYLEVARRNGAHPVLVTPVARRHYDSGGRIVDTHGDYLTAMRELAAETQTPLIDLAERSTALFESVGVEGTKDIFMWAVPGEYAAFPVGMEDNTHFQHRGAVQIAGLVVQGIRELALQPLILYLR